MVNTYIINVEEQEIGKDYQYVDPLSLGRTKRYISSEEIVNDMILEIDKLIIENIESQNNNEKIQQSKLVLHFKENIKPLVLNQTNIANLRIVTGTEKNDLFNMSQIINNGSFLVKLITQNGIRMGKQSNVTGVRISTIDKQEQLIEQKFGKLATEEQVQEIEHLMLEADVTIAQIQQLYRGIKLISDLKEKQAISLINKLKRTVEKNNQKAIEE